MELLVLCVKFFSSAYALFVIQLPFTALSSNVLQSGGLVEGTCQCCEWIWKPEASSYCHLNMSVCKWTPWARVELDLGYLSLGVEYYFSCTAIAEAECRASECDKAQRKVGAVEPCFPLCLREHLVQNFYHEL